MIGIKYFLVIFYIFIIMKNNWWKFNIDIFKDSQELISSKLAELGITTYVINMVMPFKSELNIRKLTVWLPEYRWTKIERQNFEETLKNIISNESSKSLNFYWNISKKMNG